MLALARELGIGNGRIKRGLDAAGVVGRRPGGAETARARWDGVRSAGVLADPSAGPGVPAGQRPPVRR
ncbi:MAG: hypothetical protein M3P89_03375 [Actinomycetota bacterium]|nr:hypothetical protein [Actinomycetota bacterium]